LPDRNRGSNAADFIDVRLSMRSRNWRAYRTRLDVAALAFCIKQYRTPARLPDPLTPVTTVIDYGIENEMF